MARQPGRIKKVWSRFSSAISFNFKTALGLLIPAEAYSTWKLLSLTSRESLRASFVMIGLFTPTLLAAATLVAPAALLCWAAAVLIAGCGIAEIIERAPIAKQEIHHGREMVTWQNKAGQTVVSRRVDEHDLKAADNLKVGHVTINGVSTEARIARTPSIAKGYNALAAKVTIKGPGEQKYRFLIPVSYHH